MAVESRPYLMAPVLDRYTQIMLASKQEVVNLMMSARALVQIIGKEFSHSVGDLEGKLGFSRQHFEGFRNSWIKVSMGFHELELKAEHLPLMPVFRMVGRADFDVLGSAKFWQDEVNLRCLSVLKTSQEALVNCQKRRTVLDKRVDDVFKTFKQVFNASKGGYDISAPDKEVVAALKSAMAAFLNELAVYAEVLKKFEERLMGNAAKLMKERSAVEQLKQAV